MFDIGWPELLIVAIVLVVVVGPKDLPRMLRTFGKTTNKLRSMATDFRRQFDDALKEAELDDVKSIVDDARKLDPTAEIKKQLNPMQKAGEQIKAGLDDALKPTPKPAADTAQKPDATSKAVPDKVRPAAEPAKKTRTAASSRAKTNGTASKKPAAKKPAVAKPAAKKPAARKTAARAKPKNPTRAAS